MQPTFSGIGGPGTGSIIPSSSTPYDSTSGAGMSGSGVPINPTTEQLSARMAAAPTLTANVSTPASQAKTNPAPAVITSSNAADHMAHVGDQLHSLATDALNQRLSSVDPGFSKILPEGKGDPGFVKGADSSTTPGNTPSTTSDATGIDTQIGNLLDSLSSDLNDNKNEAENTQVTGTNGEKTSISNALDENYQAEQDARTKATSDLESIAKGTYPLSPAETTLLSTTISSFQSVVRAQDTANTAYTGQIRSMLASLGIESSAPTEAAGMMYNAISVGNQKMADINSKMSLAVSKVETAFQTADTKSVMDSWKALSDSFKERNTVLEKMQTDVRTAAKDHQTALINTAKTNITALINSGRLSQTEQKNLVDASYKQGSLDEKTYKDMQTLQLNVAKFNFDQYFKMNPDAKFAALASSTKTVMSNIGKIIPSGPNAGKVLTEDLAKQSLITDHPGEATNIDDLFKTVKTLNTAAQWDPVQAAKDAADAKAAADKAAAGGK